MWKSKKKVSFCTAAFHTTVLDEKTTSWKNTLAQINFIACVKYFNDVNEWEDPSYNVQ